MPPGSSIANSSPAAGLCSTAASRICRVSDVISFLATKSVSTAKPPRRRNRLRPRQHAPFRCIVSRACGHGLSFLRIISIALSKSPFASFSALYIHHPCTCHFAQVRYLLLLLLLFHFFVTVYTVHVLISVNLLTTAAFMALESSFSRSGERPWFYVPDVEVHPPPAAVRQRRRLFHLALFQSLLMASVRNCTMISTDFAASSLAGITKSMFDGSELVSTIANTGIPRRRLSNSNLLFITSTMKSGGQAG